MRKKNYTYIVYKLELYTNIAFVSNKKPYFIFSPWVIRKFVLRTQETFQKTKN